MLRRQSGAMNNAIGVETANPRKKMKATVPSPSLDNTSTSYVLPMGSGDGGGGSEGIGAGGSDGPSASGSMEVVRHELVFEWFSEESFKKTFLSANRKSTQASADQAWLDVIHDDTVRKSRDSRTKEVVCMLQFLKICFTFI